MVKGWFPLERFFRTDLLDSRFGMLASGPARLLNDYALALRDIGEEIGYSPVEEWSLETSLSVVTWGESYFVAHAFRLERTG